MSLVETLDELKKALDKKGIDRKQFIEKIQFTMDKAMSLKIMISGLDMYNDVLELLTLQVADGDRIIADPLKRLIKTYDAIMEELDEKNRQYVKELVFQYLLK